MIVAHPRVASLLPSTLSKVMFSSIGDLLLRVRTYVPHFYLRFIMPLDILRREVPKTGRDHESSSDGVEIGLQCATGRRLRLMWGRKGKGEWEEESEKRNRKIRVLRSECRGRRKRKRRREGEIGFRTLLDECVCMYIHQNRCMLHILFKLITAVILMLVLSLHICRNTSKITDIILYHSYHIQYPFTVD